MAIEKEVKVIISAIDKTAGVYSILGKKISGLGSAIENTTKPFADFADKILKVETAFAVLSAGALTYAVKKSTEFETSSVSLSKILGDERDRIKEVEEATLALSNKYGQSATSILDATTDFKRAGFNVSDSMKLIEDSIGLVIGAGESVVDVARASEIIISTLKGFQAPASEAARLTDILNKIANEYATSVSELGTGMALISPIASGMGLSFEETAGILTPVIEVFRSGSEAANALKTGLLKLTDDSKPVRTALTQLGVAQHEANGALRSGKDILLDVQKAFVNLTDSEKIYYSNQLAGINQASKMQIVFDGLAKSTEITNVAMKSTGSIAGEIEARLKTTAVAVDRFKTGFSNLSIAIGDQFRDSVKSAIDGGTEIENALSKLVKSDVFKPVFDIINEFAKDLGEDLSNIAKNLPEAFKNVKFDKLTQSMRDLGREINIAIDNIFGQIDLTTPEGLTQAIQKIVDGFALLNNSTTGVLRGMQPLFESIGAISGEFSKLDSEAQKNATTFFGLSKTINVVAGFFNKLGPALNIITGAALVTATSNIINLATSFGITGAAILSFIPKLTALAGAGGLLTLAAAAGYSVGNMFQTLAAKAGITGGALYELLNPTNELIAKGSALQAVTLASQKMVEGIGDTAEITKDKLEAVNTEKLDTNVGLTTERFIELQDVLSLIPNLTQDVIEEIAMMPDEYIMKWRMDTASKEVALNEIKDTVTYINSEGEKITVSIPVSVDKETVEKTKEQLEKEVPTEKLLEIKTELDIAKIKEQSQVIQKSIEWKAKIDIEKAKTDAERLKTVFEGVGKTFDSTGNLLGNLFGQLNQNFGDIRDKWDLRDQIDDENKMRKEAFDLQKKITQEELKRLEYENQRRERTKDQAPVLSIQANGLKPHLEAFMWEILSEIQVRANEELSEFLLGIS